MNPRTVGRILWTGHRSNPKAVYIHKTKSGQSRLYTQSVKVLTIGIKAEIVSAVMNTILTYDMNNLQRSSRGLSSTSRTGNAIRNV
jgi:hypothetical protein